MPNWCIQDKKPTVIMLWSDLLPFQESFELFWSVNKRPSIMNRVNNKICSVSKRLRGIGQTQNLVIFGQIKKSELYFSLFQTFGRCIFCLSGWSIYRNQKLQAVRLNIKDGLKGEVVDHRPYRLIDWPFPSRKLIGKLII